MICKNCGAALADDAVFCGTCGAAVEKEAAVEIATPVAEAGETTVLTEPTVETYAMPTEQPVAPVATEYAAPQPEVAPKKKGGFPKALIPIVAVVAAVAVALVVFWPTIKGFALKTFGSPEDYLAHVESTGSDDYVDALMNGYDFFLDVVSMNKYADVKMDVELGEQALTLLESATNMKWDWLSSIGASVSMNVKENAGQANLGLLLGDQQILSLDAIVDMAEGNVYVGAPELSGTYLSAEVSDLAAAFAETEEALNFVQKALPSAKAVDALLNKYKDVALNAIGEAEKDTETVEVGDIEQKLTTLEVEISEETAVNVAIAVLETFKEDKDVQKLLKNAIDAAVDNDLVDEDDADFDDLWDELVDQIDDALDMMEDMDADDEAMYVITDYVNNKHEIVGRKIEMDGEEIAHYVTVYNGKNFETELIAADDAIVFTGKGTEKGDVVAGEFALAAYGEDIATITVDGFDTKKLADGYLNGTFTIEPSKQLLEQAELPAVLGIASPALEIKVTSDAKSFTMNVSVLAGSEMLVALNISGTTADGKAVTIPSDTMDADEADEWFEDLDFDKLISKLEDAGVPGELVESLEYVLENGLDSALGGSAAVEDYYSDYYDDYYDDYSDDLTIDYSDLYF